MSNLFIFFVLTGSVGFPPVLPPNAAIHAEVTLLECRPGKALTDYDAN
jgi:hypothetical protein